VSGRLPSEGAHALRGEVLSHDALDAGQAGAGSAGAKWALPRHSELAMKILIPVDGSDYTKRMLSYLGAHEELLGATHEFHFLTAVAPIPSYPTRFLERSVVDGYYDDEAERLLKPVRAYAEQHHWNHRATFVVGQPADAIARAAAEGRYDLIVMGSHGHTALGNVVLGSVANTVLARSKVPVLLIR
jgi:nucleotide-binding universal stress UspA family protein